MCVCVCVWGGVETGGYREAAQQLFSQAVFSSFLCEKWVRAAQHLLLAVDVGDQYAAHTVLQLLCAHGEGMFNLAVKVLFICLR